MTFFEALKPTLKEKWLNYYEANRTWLNLILKFQGGENYRIAKACLILGCISAIEPRLREFLPAFCELNSNPEALIQVLGLDFNSESELKKRQENTAPSQQTTNSK